jgi:hypothetical protein
VSQKKPNSKPVAAAKNLSEKQIARIWADLKPQILLERLRTLQPGAKWTASGNRLSACCPYHDDNTPSFHIELARGYAKCYGCEKFVSNPIELWAKLTARSRSEALLDLKQNFGLKFLTGAINTQLEAWDRNQQVKKRIMELCHDELINAIANPANPVYASSQAAVTYLVNTRSLPVDTIPTLDMLGVMPPLARIFDAMEQDAKLENARRTAEAEQNGTRVVKVTALTAEAREYMVQASASWMGALVFRLDVTPNAIGRIKLRRPDTKEFLILGDAYDEDLGFFGLGWSMYRSLLGSQQKYCRSAYLVEGEFDALSSMARQVEAGGPGFITLSSGGSSGGSQIDLLKHFGFENVCLISDAPTKKGDELIRVWLPQIQQLHAHVFTGYAQFPGASDPDEAVIKFGLPAISKVFLDTNNPSLFVTPQDWCFSRAAPELEAIPENDIRQRIECAALWGQLLKDVNECDLYVTQCKDEYKIPHHLLKRAIVAREENEPAFILRIVDVLSTLFTVVGQQATDDNRKLYLWHREQKRIIQISLADDSSVERELGTTLGPSYEMFQERIGIPNFLEPSDVAKNGTYLQKQDQQYRWYLRQALTHMAMHAPDYHSAPHKGQGIHAVRNALGGPPDLYLVNGRDVYHGVHDAVGKVSWTQTPGPTHNGIVFDVGLRAPALPMFDFIEKASDLDRAYTLNPRECWQKLHDILDIGWTFKDHALTVDFLTSHLLSVTVSDAFRRKVFMGIHADTSAGKSRLLMGLIAGTDFPRIHLIAAAKGMASYTAAGIRQSTNNSSRPLCLDEFEDEGLGDKKGKLTTEVFEMYRNLNGEGNKYTMGQRGGDPITYTLDYPVFIAAINKAKKVQDANRTIGVYLKKVPNRPDPQQVLIQTYGVDYFAQLKQDLAIALLPHIAELQTAYRDIEVEYGRGQGGTLQYDQRYFEGLYPALATMKFLGLDYRTFLTDFFEANKEALRFSATHTDSSELFHVLCESPKLIVRSESGGRDQVAMSLLKLLATQEERAQIAQTNAGLYFDEVQQVLVVNWTAAMQTVLAQHPKYSRESNLRNLRDLANRAPNALSAEELVATGVLNRLKNQGIGAIQIGYLTGYRMHDTIKSLSVNAVPTPATNAPAAAAPAVVVQLPTKAKVHDDNVNFD